MSPVVQRPINSFLSFQAKLIFSLKTFDDLLLKQEDEEDDRPVSVGKTVSLFQDKLFFAAKMDPSNSRRSTLTNAGCLLEDLEPKARSNSATNSSSNFKR